MKIIMVLVFVSSAVFAAKDSGIVFSVSASPKANQSKFKRSDNETTRTYVGNKYKGTLGYKFGIFSLLGNVVKSDLENKSETTQKREDLDYGATLRFNPVSLFFIQSSYMITNTKLTYSVQDPEKFAGERLTAGAGIRIPTPAGPAFTISGTYILNSKMRKKGASDANVVDEEGYTINFGGTLSYTY